MSATRRRLHFQLTPLLDLLLIVIFAQYLDVAQRARQESASSQRLIAERTAELEQSFAERRADLERARRAVEVERQTVAVQRAAATANVAASQKDRHDAVAQQERVADLVAELFHVPQELVDQALAPRPPGVPPRTPEETQRLRQRFKELASLRGSEVVEHLLSYDELQKRADVWSLHIANSGEIVFSSGGSQQSFRAATPEQFASRLFERYKMLEQPKGLVIFLVSYGDARADVRQAVLSGLPEAIRLMRDDRLGRTQFEYAVLGYIPDEKNTDASSSPR